MAPEPVEYEATLEESILKARAILDEAVTEHLDVLGTIAFDRDIGSEMVRSLERTLQTSCPEVPGEEVVRTPGLLDSPLRVAGSFHEPAVWCVQPDADYLACDGEENFSCWATLFWLDSRTLCFATLGCRRDDPLVLAHVRDLVALSASSNWSYETLEVQVARLSSKLLAQVRSFETETAVTFLVGDYTRPEAVAATFVEAAESMFEAQGSGLALLRAGIQGFCTGQASEAGVLGNVDMGYEVRVELEASSDVLAALRVAAQTGP